MSKKNIPPKVESINKNFGFIELGPGRTDFLAGTLPFEQRIKSGNWGKYLSSPELQRRDGVDVMACVSFSNCNEVEAQLNWMIAVGRLKPTEPAYVFLKNNGYFDKNGLIDLSDRFLAKMSGTTRAGNSLQRVSDAGRHFGYVPESVWPWPEGASWDKYYKEIPSNIKELGKRFLRFFEISYEFLNKSDIVGQLMHAPIQIGIATCPGWWSESVIKACNGRTNHAIIAYGYEKGKYYEAYDHYNNVNKKLTWNYHIPFAMKNIISKKNFVPSDLKIASKLLKNLRRFQVAILPERNGEMYLMDVSQGKNSWKFHLNEYGLAQQFKHVAHGISNTMADGIRTIENLDEIKYLYK